jgi:ribonuclease-3
LRASSISASGLGEAAGKELAGEELGRIVKSGNVSAALLEAAMAALFLEHGYEKIAPAIVAAFSDRIEYGANDPRRPQDRVAGGAREDGPQRQLRVLDVDGPPHDVLLLRGADRRRGARAGTGRTKKEAEQEAAKQALAAIGA